jgi:hypothetical protein
LSFRKDLEPMVRRAEAEILRLARQRVPGVRLDRVGPINIEAGSSGSPSWSCWVITSTDVEKEMLANDPALLPLLLKAAAEAGFAPASITFQSQQTVDRDFEGSWFYAMR